MKPIRHYPLAAAALGAALLASTAFSGAHAADVRKVVRDTHNNIVVNTFENCVRTDWAGGRDACGAIAAAPAPQVSVETNVEKMALDQRTVYFEFDKSNLTPEARKRLDALASNLKSDENVREASIVGYADRIGDTDYNDRLSQKRANAVNDYLASRGVINTRVTETRWFGESNPTTTCEEGLDRNQLIACLAKDRRVEVEVDYKPSSN